VEAGSERQRPAARASRSKSMANLLTLAASEAASNPLSETASNPLPEAASNPLPEAGRNPLSEAVRNALPEATL
jgi:hypothetical protein